MDTRKLEQAEEQIRNARSHSERGAEGWAEAFLKDALRLIAEAKQA